jgi:predicted nucleotidyltransferase
VITPVQIEKCVEVACRYGARRLVLFGSAAEDPTTARDIDLICDGVEPKRFFEMAGMLEHEVGVLVDVVPAEPRTRFVEVNMRRGHMIYESA